MQTLKFSFLAKFMLLAGATGGLIAAVFYVIGNFGAISAGEILLVLLLAPVCQALVVLLYGLVGFPVYRYFAKKQKFGLADPWGEDRPA